MYLCGGVNSVAPLPHPDVGDHGVYWETLHPSCHHVLHISGEPTLLVREQFAVSSEAAASAPAAAAAAGSAGQVAEAAAAAATHLLKN